MQMSQTPIDPVTVRHIPYHAAQMLRCGDGITELMFIQ